MYLLSSMIFYFAPVLVLTQITLSFLFHTFYTLQNILTQRGALIHDPEIHGLMLSYIHSICPTWAQLI